jgi:hypothetical protein
MLMHIQNNKIQGVVPEHRETAVGDITVSFEVSSAVTISIENNTVICWNAPEWLVGNFIDTNNRRIRFKANINKEGNYNVKYYNQLFIVEQCGIPILELKGMDMVISKVTIKPKLVNNRKVNSYDLTMDIINVFNQEQGEQKEDMFKELLKELYNPLSLTTEVNARIQEVINRHLESSTLPDNTKKFLALSEIAHIKLGQYSTVDVSSYNADMCELEDQNNILVMLGSSHLLVAEADRYATNILGLDVSLKALSDGLDALTEADFRYRDFKLRYLNLANSGPSAGDKRDE